MESVNLYFLTGFAVLLRCNNSCRLLHSCAFLCSLVCQRIKLKSEVLTLKIKFEDSLPKRQIFCVHFNTLVHANLTLMVIPIFKKDTENQRESELKR